MEEVRKEIELTSEQQTQLEPIQSDMQQAIDKVMQSVDFPP